MMSIVIFMLVLAGVNLAGGHSTLPLRTKPLVLVVASAYPVLAVAGVFLLFKNPAATGALTYVIAHALLCPTVCGVVWRHRKEKRLHYFVSFVYIAASGLFGLFCIFGIAYNLNTQV